MKFTKKFLIIIVWTAFISISCIWNFYVIDKNINLVVKKQSQSFFNGIQTTREWGAEHGGVYVPITETTKPNPYLNVPNRDIYIDSLNIALTKVNPAFMTRQIGELSLKNDDVVFHITSLMPLRPQNKADNWETIQLRKFEEGATEVLEYIKEDSIYRYMAVLPVKKACMQCHAQQGYEIGDIRGGISINIKAKDYQKTVFSQKLNILTFHIIFFIIGVVGILLFIWFSEKQLRKLKHEKQIVQEKNRRIESDEIKIKTQLEELQASSEELRQNNEELLTLNDNLTEANDLIKEKNKIIKKTHKNITDSINYAKTIQESLLTSKTLINKYIDEYFILFKAKEQVSGDFYYINKIGKHITIAIADCTGHGVPGGFLTMLGITHLHEILNRKETGNPGYALDFLRERFKKTFKKFGSNKNHALDIALCVIDTETNMLQYAGAYNPLIIIRNNKLIEYKATRNPIGFYPKEKNFKNNEIQLQDNDFIYLFTDGFQDQLSGKDNVKLKSTSFKKILIDIHKLPVKIQENKLNKIFEDWKDKSQQTDDVLIFGMKFSQQTKVKND